MHLDARIKFATTYKWISGQYWLTNSFTSHKMGWIYAVNKLPLRLSILMGKK